MSIDHGNVLAELIEEIREEANILAIDDGRGPLPVAYYVERFRALAQPAEADDQEWDRQAEALQVAAFGPGTGINPDATDITNIFLSEGQPAEAVEGAAPLPMLLFCPRCHSQHVDEPDERTPGWLNPPHRSHLCHACGCIWRPADVATVGVREIATRGKADNWSLSDDAAQGAVATVCLVGERYAHGHMVSVELQLAGEDAPAPNIGDRYYTRPQAAPEQGDGNAVCVWQQDDEDGEGFSTGCGNYYLVNDADTDGMSFCLFCGNKAEFAKAGDEDE